MKVWPFGSREKRAAQAPGSQGGGGYTDAVVRALLAHAAGGVSADPSATAALEAAAGAYSRAFAVASVEPATPATRALTAEVLSLMARDLIRRGEFCHVIEVGRGGARLVPVGSRGTFEAERTRRRGAIAFCCPVPPGASRATCRPRPSFTGATALTPLGRGPGYPRSRGRPSPGSSTPTLRTRSQTKPAGPAGTCSRSRKVRTLTRWTR